MQDLPKLMKNVPSWKTRTTNRLLKKVLQVSQTLGQDVMETMYDMLIAGEGKELYQPLGGYQSYSLDYQKKLLEHPNVLFGLRMGRSLRCDSGRNADVHNDPLGKRQNQGRKALLGTL